MKDAEGHIIQDGDVIRHYGYFGAKFEALVAENVDGRLIGSWNDGGPDGPLDEMACYDKETDTLNDCLYLHRWKDTQVYSQSWPNSERKIITHTESGASVFLEVFNRDQDAPVKKGDAYIWGLFVLDAFRCKGIAEKLLADANVHAVAAGCSRIFIEWSHVESAPWVLEWYERIGYSEVGTSENSTLLMKNLIKGGL